MAMNGITTGNSINVTTASATYESVTISASVTKNTASESASASTAASSTESAAAVYEKSNEDKKTQNSTQANQKVDRETIDKLKADAEARTAQLRSLVEKLLTKQGKTFEIASLGGLANVYKNLEVDEETKKQAQEDISDDGYWGVEATSDRIVDFAKALAGDNVEMAQKMLDAVKEGFKQAGKEWGEDLPEISNKTMDATYSKLNDWIKSLGGNTGASQTVSTSSSINVTATYTRVSASTSSFSATVGSADINE